MMTKTLDPEFSADWTVESYVERKPWSTLPPTVGVISCHARVEVYQYLSHLMFLQIRTKCYSNQITLDFLIRPGCIETTHEYGTD